MENECFIGIDQGSSSTKAISVSAAGQVIFQTKVDLSPPVREGTRVEQDPGEVLDSVKKAIDESVRAVTNSGFSALGIGLSCQRSSCLAWSGSGAGSRSPVISWRDTRGLDLVDALSARAAFIFNASGLPLTPYYSASKFRWLRDNLPAVREAGVFFGTLSSFLIQRLTGNARPEIDHTNAARTQLMNVHTLSWDPELIEAFGLSGISLPEITPTAHAFGEVPTPAGPVPLLACIGDQQAAMLGLGVIERGDAGINYGTGGFLMTSTGAGLVSAEGLMSSVHFSTERERTFLLEGSVNAVGDALEWLRVRLGLFHDYAEADDLCWKALTNVVAFLGIGGTGAPHWEPVISSAFHGLTAESAPADLVRAAVENIAFFMKDIDEAMRAAGAHPASYALSGGVSSLSYLAQAQADLLGRDVTIGASAEASSLGAAFVAGLQHGTWSVADIRRMTARGEPVPGEANPGLERRYRRWKALHRVAKEIDAVG
jgi:glycerol kinase